MRVEVKGLARYFPSNSPERWRERMALAAAAATVFGFLAAQFGSQLFSAVDRQSVADISYFGLALLTLTTSGFLSLALAFLLFAFIKLDSTGRPRFLTWKLRAKRIGDALIVIAFALGIVWIIVRIAANQFT